MSWKKSVGRVREGDEYIAQYVKGIARVGVVTLPLPSPKICSAA
jgi:hypothetical protein